MIIFCICANPIHRRTHGLCHGVYLLRYLNGTIRIGRIFKEKIDRKEDTMRFTLLALFITMAWGQTGIDIAKMVDDKVLPKDMSNTTKMVR